MYMHSSLQDLYIIVIDLNLITLLVPLVLLRIPELQIVGFVSFTLADNSWWWCWQFGRYVAGRYGGHGVR